MTNLQLPPGAGWLPGELCGMEASKEPLEMFHEQSQDRLRGAKEEPQAWA